MLGNKLGPNECILLGKYDGIKLGISVGTNDGTVLGNKLGLIEGTLLGKYDGRSLGIFDGTNDG